MRTRGGIGFRLLLNWLHIITPILRIRRAACRPCRSIASAGWNLTISGHRVGNRTECAFRANAMRLRRRCAGRADAIRPYMDATPIVRIAVPRCAVSGALRSTHNAKTRSANADLVERAVYAVLFSSGRRTTAGGRRSSRSNTLACSRLAGTAPSCLVRTRRRLPGTSGAQRGHHRMSCRRTSRRRSCSSAKNHGGTCWQRGRRRSGWACW